MAVFDTLKAARISPRHLLEMEEAPEGARILVFNEHTQQYRLFSDQMPVPAGETRFQAILGHLQKETPV